MNAQFLRLVLRPFKFSLLLLAGTLVLPAQLFAQTPATLIDVDFGAGSTTSEVGFAATGQTSSDFWNFYTRDDGQGGYLSFGSLANLKYADGNASGAGLTIANAPGCWGNGATDQMYSGYLYPAFGGNITVTLTNVSAGSYSFYIYGHGDADYQNSTYQLSVNGQSYGSKTTLNGPGWDSSAVWQQGLQYVEFQNVVITAGQTVTITVLPASSSYAIIAGLQIAGITSATVAPVVTNQPTSQTVTAGGTGSFSVGASGTAPLSYQWQYGTTPIAGATGTTLTLANVQTSQAGNYSVIVSNSVGFTVSSNAVLTVTPVIVSTNTLSLLDVQFCALGNPGTLKVLKTGFAAIGQTANDFWNAYSRDGADGSFLTYGVLNNLELVDGTPTSIGMTVANAPGAWSNGSSDPMYATYLYPFDGGNITVTLSNLNAGTYDVYVYGHGSDQNGVYPDNNMNGVYQLSAGGVDYGTQTTSTSGTGWSSPTWQEGQQYVVFRGVTVYNPGQPFVLTGLPGASGEAIISGIQIAQTAGSATVAPVITAQPGSQTVTASANVSFNVGVTGSWPLSYQWQYGTSAIAGATTSTLTLANVQTSQAGNYSVIVSNSVGFTVSSNAVLTVTPVIVSTNSLSLLDVQFCALGNPGTLKVLKTGFAAVGQTANDYWNAYSRDGADGSFLTYGVLNNLELVDGTPTSVGMTVANAPGAWSNGSSDPMYATYLYPFDGGNITVTLSNLNAGTYNFYLYGHGNVDDQNSAYQVSVNGQSYGSQSTVDGPGWNSVVWQQGVQYVEFQNVVVNAGQTVTITVSPVDSNYAVLSGLQIAQTIGSAPVAPVITAQPASQTVITGANVSFNVGVTGSWPLSYQWQYGTSAIAGATSATLTLANVQVADSGNYSVIVSNSAGFATSSNAVLTVTPIIVSTNSLPLIDVDFGAGSSTTEVGFAATGQTSSDLWNFYTRDDGQGGYLSFGSLANLKYVDGSVSGAGLTIANAPGCWGNGAADPMYNGYLYPFDGGNITVTLTNLNAGSYAFYVYGHGNADNQNSTYQLSVNGQSYGSYTTVNGPGWGSSAVWQQGLQYVEFPNVVILAGQTVTLTVLPANSTYAVISGLQIAQVTPSVSVAPVITNQPASQTVMAGTNVSFSVGVSGSFPLSYQWQFDSNNIVGATSSTLVLTNAQPANAGIYSVIVTNPAGSSTSSNATLTVTPVVYSPVASNLTVALIENTSVAITLSGSDPDGDALTYTVVTQPGNGTLSGTAPNLTYQPAANYSGPDSFTFMVNDGPGASATATVSINVLAQTFGSLIDVAFGAGTNTAEVGFAATGKDTNDFWNFYSRDDCHGGWRSFGVLTNLEYVDTTASGTVLTIANAPGAWGNGSSDPMYGTYLYPFDGGNITVTVSNLAAGSYTFYIYGHGAADDQNCTYQLSVDQQSYGSQTTAGPGWNSAVWQEGLQYVEFQGVNISAGQLVTITALPGSGGYAVISGLQMAQAAPPVSGASHLGRQQALLFKSNSQPVTPPPPMLSTVAGGSGHFGLKFAGAIGSSYRVEAADEPGGTWTPIAIVTVDKSPYTFVDPDATLRTKRFYRVVLLPPPQ